MNRTPRALLLTASLVLLASCGPSSTGGGGGGTGPTGKTDPGWHCFELSWTDKDSGQAMHNSECVRSDELCADDVKSMKGYFAEATYNGCFHQQDVFCYSTGGDRPLCFVNLADCQRSRSTIGGGECTAGEPGAGTTATVPTPQPTGGAGFYCFGVGWTDTATGQAGHNSECVAGQEHCEKDLQEMKGYFADGQYTNGCVHLATAYCYKMPSSGHPLCYMDMRDCENGIQTMQVAGVSCAAYNAVP